MFFSLSALATEADVRLAFNLTPAKPNRQGPPNVGTFIMPATRPSRSPRAPRRRAARHDPRQGELFPLQLTAYSAARRVEELAAKTRREARLVAQLDRIATPGEWDRLDEAGPVVGRAEIDALLVDLPEQIDAAERLESVDDAYALAGRQERHFAALTAASAGH